MYLIVAWINIEQYFANNFFFKFGFISKTIFWRSKKQHLKTTFALSLLLKLQNGISCNESDDSKEKVQDEIEAKLEEMETGKRSSGLCNDNNNQTGSDVTNDLKMENGEELVKTSIKFSSKLPSYRFYKFLVSSFLWVWVFGNMIWWKFKTWRKQNVQKINYSFYPNLLNNLICFKSNNNN